MSESLKIAVNRASEAAKILSETTPSGTNSSENNSQVSGKSLRTARAVEVSDHEQIDDSPSSDIENCKMQHEEQECLSLDDIMNAKRDEAALLESDAEQDVPETRER